MDQGIFDLELRRDEGVRYTIYPDIYGNPTTAVGHNLNAAPIPADWSYPLNDDQVDSLLDHDTAISFAALDLHFPWWRQLDEVRQRVIGNMCFNMGIGKLMGFVHTMAFVKSGDYAAAASGMEQSAWYGQVGARAVRLKTAMETGVMPDEPKA